MTKRFEKIGGYVSSLPRLIGMLALLLTVQVASATSIQYELSSLGGSNYRSDYTVSNDGRPVGCPQLSGSPSCSIPLCTMNHPLTS